MSVSPLSVVFAVGTAFSAIGWASTEDETQKNVALIFGGMFLLGFVLSTAKSLHESRVKPIETPMLLLLSKS